MPQARSGQTQKISPAPGFDLRTVQRVASHYTDCASRPTRDEVTLRICLSFLLYIFMTCTHNARFGFLTAVYVTITELIEIISFSSLCSLYAWIDATRSGS